MRALGLRTLAPTIRFSSVVSRVGVYYVALDPIVLTAYDSGNNVLGSKIGTANTDGTTGFNSLLSVSFPNTSYVTLGNTGLADEYVFDDLSFTSQLAIPEPASLPLLALGCIFLWWRARRLTLGLREEPILAALVNRHGLFSLIDLGSPDADAKVSGDLAAAIEFLPRRCEQWRLILAKPGTQIGFMFTADPGLLIFAHLFE